MMANKYHDVVSFLQKFLNESVSLYEKEQYGSVDFKIVMEKEFQRM